MKIVKKTGVAGEFAKVNEDIKDGDVVEIMNAGDVVTGKFGDQLVFQIQTKNGVKNKGFNQTSLNSLVDEFGDDSENWIGKKAVITVVRTAKGLAGYVSPEGYELNNDGKFVKKN